MARTAATQDQKYAQDFPVSDYFELKKMVVNSCDHKDKDGIEQKVEIEKLTLKQGLSLLQKQQINTAKFFNIPLDHLKKGAELLNARKIDGIIIGELIGRHGYFDGHRINRDSLAKRYQKTIMQIEIAESKLKSILKREDIAQAYKEYSAEIINEESLQSINAARFGE